MSEPKDYGIAAVVTNCDCRDLFEESFEARGGVSLMISFSGSKNVAVMLQSIGLVDIDPVARRLVACWNFLEGQKTEAFEGKDFGEFFAQQVFITGLNPAPDGEGFVLGLKGIAAQMMAASFAGQFVGTGAINYLQLNFHHPETGPLSVTIQRTEGKTPSQLKAEVEVERDALLAALQKYEAARDAMFAQCCSNPVYDAWGDPVDMTAFNDAHLAATDALAKVGAQ